MAIKIRTVVANEILNPRLVGSGSIANSLFAYENSGGTAVGSRSVSGGAQTITLNSISGGLYRYGVSTSLGGPTALARRVKAGTVIRAGYTADMTNISSCSAAVLLVLYYADGTNTSGAPATQYVSGSTANVSVSLSTTASKDVTGYIFYMSIKSSGTFSGTSIMICTAPYVIADPLTGSPTGYFDGSSGTVGSLGTAQWSGSVDASVSIVPYFDDAPIKASAIQNKVLNPNFAGSGSSANGWSNYTNGTTITGTRAFGGNALTLTATSLIGGSRRFGSTVTGSSTSATQTVRLKTGEKIYSQVDIDASGLTSGTRVFLYFEARRADNSVIQYVEQASTSSGTLASIHTATEDVYFNTWFIVGISSSSDWTGTSTAIVSKAMWIHLRAGESPPVWFSGDSSGARWEGTANNSVSTLGGFRDASLKRWDGTNWVTA